MVRFLGGLGTGETTSRRDTHPTSPQHITLPIPGINAEKGYPMETRIKYSEISPEGYRAMLNLDQYARSSGLEHSLLK